MIFIKILIAVLIILIVTKIYQKLITGICQCSAHMVGKVVIITGGNNGIGLEVAKDLAYRGARVILACRSMARANAAKELIIKETGNTNIDCQLLDSESLRSVRDFCKRINETVKRLDVLINNAGTGIFPNKLTEDGLNTGLQVNYFAPFLLTCLLLPLLKSSSPSRIINLSSVMHIFGKINIKDINLNKKYYFKNKYSTSKLCINLMTLELSKKLKGTGVTVNATHPGVAATNIINGMPSKIFRTILTTFIKIMFQSTWEAAQTPIYLAVSPEVKDVSGKYFCHCREKTPSKASQDEDLARKVWIVTESLVNYLPPEN